MRVPRSMLPVFNEIVIFDPYRAADILAPLPQRPIIVDIGANVGYFSMLALALRPDCRVHSFEPLPANFRLLAEHHRENPAHSPRWTLHQKAVVGTELAEIQIHCDTPDQPTSVASLSPEWMSRNTQAVTVPAITLDQIVRSHHFDTVDLLKLDCEGAEYDILFNTPADTLHRIATLAIETHNAPNLPGNHEQLIEFLNAHGFHTKSQQWETKDLHIVWAKRSEEGV